MGCVWFFTPDGLTPQRLNTTHAVSPHVTSCYLHLSLRVAQLLPPLGFHLLPAWTLQRWHSLKRLRHRRVETMSCMGPMCNPVLQFAFARRGAQSTWLQVRDGEYFGAGTNQNYEVQLHKMTRKCMSNITFLENFTRRRDIFKTVLLKWHTWCFYIQ